MEYIECSGAELYSIIFVNKYCQSYTDPGLNGAEKAIIVIAVVACFLAAASAQNPMECGTNRAAQLANCLGQVGTGGSAFCTNCRSSLISYYNDCTNGVGTAGVNARKPKACKDITG